MSQKNETTILVLALLLTMGLLGAGSWWFADRAGVKISDLLAADKDNPKPKPLNQQSLQNRISFGEETLFSGESPAKVIGTEAIAAGKLTTAIANFEAVLSANRNDPETLIFLNNARIDHQKSYTIAVSVPIGSNPNGALEILRGVAQAQAEINATGGIKGVPLKVAIANDDNDPEIAQQIASALVNHPDVLGVVGHYASDVSLAAGKIYHSGRLTAISPISTSDKLSGFSSYVFRTVPSDYVAARALANYVLTELQQQQAAVFFNSQSSYSKSLKSEFVTAISLGGGQVASEFDFSRPGFSAAKSLEQATKLGAEVLMLAPSTDELDKALQVVQVNRKRLDLLGGDAVYTLKTLEVGGDQATEMVVAVPWHIEIDPKSDFPQQSRKLWGADVNWRTALSYDATQALSAALKRRPTRSGVQQALLAPDFSSVGASGTIRFLPSGDRNAPVRLVKVVAGSRSGTGYDFVPVPQ